MEIKKSQLLFIISFMVIYFSAFWRFIWNNFHFYCYFDLIFSFSLLEWRSMIEFFTKLTHAPMIILIAFFCEEKNLIFGFILIFQYLPYAEFYITLIFVSIFSFLLQLHLFMFKDVLPTLFFSCKKIRNWKIRLWASLHRGHLY